MQTVQQMKYICHGLIPKDCWWENFMRKLPDHIQLPERTFQKEVIPPPAIQNVFCKKNHKEY